MQEVLMADSRPAEELYDITADPHETRNLLGSEEHREDLDRLRAALDDWIEEADEQGRFPEPPEVLEFWEAQMEKNYGERLCKRAAERDR